MADLGLGQAFGADATAQRLRQQILDQLQQKQAAQQADIQNRSMALQEQEAKRKEQDFQQTIQERQAEQVAKSHAGDVTNAAKLAPQLPMDQNVAPQAAGILRAGGMGGQLYTPPTMGETETGKPFDAATANPAMNLGTEPQQADETFKRGMNALADQSTIPSQKMYLRARAMGQEKGPLDVRAFTEPNGPPGAAPKTANYMFKGQPITGIEHNGRVMYQNQDVTDQVKPYVAPVPPTVLNLQGVGPFSVPRGGTTATPITGPGGEALKPADKPVPYQAAQQAASLNTAEVEGVKVLKALHQSGLEDSNNPADPRWENFVVTTLKMAPGDFAKADIQQRTAFVQAALTRQLMGGRPSQYVAQMIQQHLPQGQMTGQQLHHVLNNVLQQATEQRTELTQMIPGIKGPVSGQGYQDFLAEVANGSNSRPRIRYDMNGKQLP